MCRLLTHSGMFFNLLFYLRFKKKIHAMYDKCIKINLFVIKCEVYFLSSMHASRIRAYHSVQKDYFLFAV